MRLFSILAAIGLGTAGLLGACKGGGQPSGATSEHGHTYINHTNKNGVKPQVGDKILCHVDVFIGDSLFNGTRQEGQNSPIELVVPKPEEVPAGKPLPPLFDAMFIGTKGDSMTFYQKVDSTLEKSMKMLPKRFQEEKNIRYEIVFVDVITAADMQKKQDEAQAQFVALQAKMPQVAADYKAGKLNDKITTLPSGLKMIVDEKGSGAPFKQGERAEVHYYGCLTDGKVFDNSFQRGEPIGFALGMKQMIPGFDEGVQQLNHGGKATLFIPSKLGYGEQASGPIPANSELIFYIEVQ